MRNPLRHLSPAYPVLGWGRTAAASGGFTLLVTLGTGAVTPPVRWCWAGSLQPYLQGTAAAGLRGGRGASAPARPGGTPGTGSALGTGGRGGRLQREACWKLAKQGPCCRGNPLSSRGLVRRGRKYSRCFEIDVSKQVFIVPACKKG